MASPQQHRTTTAVKNEPSKQGLTMSKMFLGAVAIAAVLSTPALSADMPLRAPPVAAPIYNWTGCFVKGGGGYGMWNQSGYTAHSLASRSPRIGQQRWGHIRLEMRDESHPSRGTMAPRHPSLRR
jgi:opacity protein-like surface antigen